MADRFDDRLDLDTLSISRAKFVEHKLSGYSDDADAVILFSVAESLSEEALAYLKQNHFSYTDETLDFRKLIGTYYTKELKYDRKLGGVIQALVRNYDRSRTYKSVDAYGSNKWTYSVNGALIEPTIDVGKAILEAAFPEIVDANVTQSETRYEQKIDGLWYGEVNLVEVAQAVVDYEFVTDYDQIKI